MAVTASLRFVSKWVLATWASFRIAVHRAGNDLGPWFTSSCDYDRDCGVRGFPIRRNEIGGRGLLSAILVFQDPALYIRRFIADNFSAVHPRRLVPGDML